MSQLPPPNFTRSKAPSDILVVDDYPPVARVIVRALSSRVRRVDHAPSAIHAIHALEAHPYGVVVSDQRMRGPQGSALLNYIAARWPRVRLILMSGWIDAALLASCPAAHRVIDKSFPMERIVEVILEEAHSVPPFLP